eukprot:gnl/TRDRNA2_/TRDRNA2_182311_c0_seq1.p1 gnl/TRDRNA2_/TRDRNA2_182311_c0~~gnl/TRDRNA2_/TRDRNA2_182311_c0_seq1.p1  ORF type:complete len:575 (-),score=147.40 gnl/TRDRNA2_/TRDRNA2_182311_c0_seq1:178-1902(-)
MPSRSANTKTKQAVAKYPSAATSKGIDKDITDVFKRFDRNGDGFITRDELAHVFRTLDAVYWDDKRIDAVLTAADSTGDKKLKFEEFVAWLVHEGDEWEEARNAAKITGLRHFATSDLTGFRKEKISKFYEEMGMIAENCSSGDVVEMLHKKTSTMYAVKMVHKKGIRKEALETEVAVMKEMDHPNIVRLHEVFEDAQNINLVMEMCTGGELFDRIIMDEIFDEKKAASVMAQVFEGLAYMHRKNLCHGDIQPKNILFREPKERVVDLCVKIIDFGLTRRFGPDDIWACDKSFERLFYASPQALQGFYEPTADMWSAGIITYQLLAGYPPFCGETDRETRQLIKQGGLSFPREDWAQLSQDSKDIVGYLLSQDKQARYTAEQAQEHTWIKNTAPRAENMPLRTSQQNIQKFRGRNKLKKVAMHTIARRLNNRDVETLREEFAVLDKNNDGTVTFHEFKAGIDRLAEKESAKDLRSLLEEMDVDGSRCIEYTEYLAAALDQKYRQEEKTCWQAFQVFDKDGSGKISKKELEQVLQNSQVEAEIGASSIARVLKEADKNKDDSISFDEFIKMMRSS